MYLLYISGTIFSGWQLTTAISYMAIISELSIQLTTKFHKNLTMTMIFSNASYKKKIKSCKGIYCRIGILFFVEKSTKLAYISYLLHSFISILLA